MDRKFSAFWLQDHASGSLPKPPESRPHLLVFFEITLLLLSSHLLTGLPSYFFPLGFSIPTYLSYPPSADHPKNVHCFAAQITCSALLREIACIRLTKTLFGVLDICLWHCLYK